MLAKRAGRLQPREPSQTTRIVRLAGSRWQLLGRAEIAGPGFINFYLARASWHDLLARVLREAGLRRWIRGRSDRSRRARAGRVRLGQPDRSRSTIGHGRNAVAGGCGRAPARGDRPAGSRASTTSTTPVARCEFSPNRSARRYEQSAGSRYRASRSKDTRGSTWSRSPGRAGGGARRDLLSSTPTSTAFKRASRRTAIFAD